MVVYRVVRLAVFGPRWRVARTTLCAKHIVNVSSPRSMAFNAPVKRVRTFARAGGSGCPIRTRGSMDGRRAKSLFAKRMREQGGGSGDPKWRDDILAKDPLATFEYISDGFTDCRSVLCSKCQKTHLGKKNYDHTRHFEHFRDCDGPFGSTPGKQKTFDGMILDGLVLRTDQEQLVKVPCPGLSEPGELRLGSRAYLHGPLPLAGLHVME